MQTPIFSKHRLGAVATDRATIRHMPMSSSVLNDFCKAVDPAVEMVCDYLGAAPPVGLEIRLVDRPRVSATWIAEAMIVISILRLPNKAALLHELTHIVSGTSHDPHGVLDEGLAVHVQSALAGPEDRSFPSEGGDLDTETLASMGRFDSHLPLLATRAVRQTGTAEARRLAYLQQGSFVRFLIRRYEVPCLMNAYRGKASWSDSFGATIEELECAWLSSLGLRLDTSLRRPQPSGSTQV